MQSQLQFQMMLTRRVKQLIIANVAIWFFGVLILQKFILKKALLYDWFGLTPIDVIGHGYIWQLFTYMFLHASSAYHVLFNMLMLWMFGCELERLWGGRLFLRYFFGSGVGAALIYVLGIWGYCRATGNPDLLGNIVVGASGGVFGLLVAYGYEFRNRTLYFMMVFPMKAKHMAMVMGAISIVTILDSGVGTGVAHLAHLGGFITGGILLWFWRVRPPKSGTRVKSSKNRGRDLRLVVDNESSPPDTDNGPRYWN